MSGDGMVVLISVLLVFGGVAYFIFWTFAKSVRLGRELLSEREAKKVRAREWVEHRVLALFQEFPDMAAQNPGAIALLVHDELVNRHVTDQDFLMWAVPATSERLWRTVLVEAERSQRSA